MREEKNKAKQSYRQSSFLEVEEMEEVLSETDTVKSLNDMEFDDKPGEGNFAVNIGRRVSGFISDITKPRISQQVPHT